MTLPDKYRIARYRSAGRLAGACVLGVAMALSVQDFADARSALSDRPPLPAMGPSLRKAVAFATTEQPGTIIIRKDEKALYLVTRQGQALRYQISVGREYRLSGSAGKRMWSACMPVTISLPIFQTGAAL